MCQELGTPEEWALRPSSPKEIWSRVAAFALVMSSGHRMVSHRGRRFLRAVQACALREIGLILWLFKARILAEL